MSTQAKRMAFYASERRRRRIRRLIKANQGRPGFIGAVTEITLNTEDCRSVKLGPGALFFGSQS